MYALPTRPSEGKCLRSAVPTDVSVKYWLEAANGQQGRVDDQHKKVNEAINSFNSLHATPPLNLVPPHPIFWARPFSVLPPPPHLSPRINIVEARPRGRPDWRTLCPTRESLGFN
ncbi:hypothetical protein BgiMline_002248 [Biomphalaria glabrata]